MVSINDLKQAAIGAFASTIFFFALKGGETGPFIDTHFGLIIFFVWAYLLYQPYKKRGKNKEQFFSNLIIISIICSILTINFGLATFDQIMGIAFFGSPAAISTMMALPLATVFDLENNTSVLSKYVTKKR